MDKEVLRIAGAVMQRPDLSGGLPSVREYSGTRGIRDLRSQQGPSVPLTHPQSAHTQNSYDFVRFCAASAVLFSHHFDLAGFAEPQVPLLGMDFGQLGVSVFFCLSGFLIAQSLETSSDPARFFA